MKMDVIKFDRIAREVFSPVYSVIAQQIKERTGISEGVCLDIGAGGGYLGIALAMITGLHVFLLDNSPEMLEIAQRNIIERDLETKVGIVSGDAHEIPFEDESANLVISRGSVFFWKNKVRAFNEIHRVLAPGGKAYVGGGLGTPEIAKQVRTRMNKIDINWPGRREKNSDSHKTCSEALSISGIAGWSIKKSNAGLWIEICK
jgi:ubiquinone/menaquinone biosynthesis C-methylase UbiE